MACPKFLIIPGRANRLTRWTLTRGGGARHDSKLWAAAGLRRRRGMSKKVHRSLLTDLLPPFEAAPSSTHMRNAFGAIERLADEGRAFWPEGAGQQERWRRGCTELKTIINQLGARRHIEKQELATAFREFIHAFEHHSDRLLQMLSPKSYHEVARIARWMDFVYRCATYAMVAFWIDDKDEQVVTRVSMVMNTTTGETAVAQETEVTKAMVVPKKYHRATRRIFRYS